MGHLKIDKPCRKSPYPTRNPFLYLKKGKHCKFCHTPLNTRKRIEHHHFECHAYQQVTQTSVSLQDLEDYKLLQLINSKDKYPFPCICGKGFYTQGQLSRHSKKCSFEKNLTKDDHNLSDQVEITSGLWPNTIHPAEENSEMFLSSVSDHGQFLFENVGVTPNEENCPDISQSSTVVTLFEQPKSSKESESISTELVSLVSYESAHVCPVDENRIQLPDGLDNNVEDSESEYASPCNNTLSELELHDNDTDHQPVEGSSDGIEAPETERNVSPGSSVLGPEKENSHDNGRESVDDDCQIVFESLSSSRPSRVTFQTVPFCYPCMSSLFKRIQTRDCYTQTSPKKSEKPTAESCSNQTQSDCNNFENLPLTAPQGNWVPQEINNCSQTSNCHQYCRTHDVHQVQAQPLSTGYEINGSQDYLPFTTPVQPEFNLPLHYNNGFSGVTNCANCPNAMRKFPNLPPWLNYYNAVDPYRLAGLHSFNSVPGASTTHTMTSSNDVFNLSAQQQDVASVQLTSDRTAMPETENTTMSWLSDEDNTNGGIPINSVVNNYNVSKTVSKQIIFFNDSRLGSAKENNN